MLPSKSMVRDHARLGMAASSFLLEMRLCTEGESLLCRGGMIFTFYKARGMAVGSSLVEEDKLDLAKKLEEAAKAKGVEFILPTDVVIADKFDENANTKVVSADAIPEGWMVSCASGLDFKDLRWHIIGCRIVAKSAAPAPPS